MENNKNILFIIFIIVLLAILFTFPVKYISNYVHETGHINEAKKLNIDFYADFSISTYLSGDGSASAHPKTREDCEKFNSLTLEEKKKITHAGVKYQAVFFTLSLLIILFVILVYREKLKQRNSYFLIILASISLLILCILLGSLVSNVIWPNPANDWHLMILDCSGF